MGKSERKVGTAVGSEFEEHDDEQSAPVPEREPRGPSEAAPAARARPSGPTAGGPFHVLKPGQGVRVRWGSAIGAGVLSLAFAHFVWTQIEIFNFGEKYQLYVRTLVPVVLFLVLAYLIFWLVGRHPRVIDFMIATEGEMKKVSWPTRSELVNSTIVVIVISAIAALLVGILDFIFATSLSMVLRSR